MTEDEARKMPTSAIVETLAAFVAMTHPVKWGGPDLDHRQHRTREILRAELNTRIPPSA